MIRSSWLAFALVGWLLASDALAVGDPEQTVRESDEVLAEIVTIPGRQVPAQLLSQAQGVAVIPNVLKIGFIGGVRRGHGVVLVRDAEGEWGLPQFVVLTGGSVGWQAGLQATDVVLVFLTKKSIDGLMTGKFTLGADAAVSAGPVGRNAAAATDGQLKAEILSYSRSRGLFAGVALDGSVIQIDQEAHVGYYGTPSNMPPARVPPSALGLVQELAAVSNPGQVLPPASISAGGVPGGVPVGVPPGVPVGAPVQPTPPMVAPVPPRPDVIRRALARDATNLYALLDPQWREYLALPREAFDAGPAAPPPPLAGLQLSQQKFERIVQDPQFQALAQRPEFQATRDVLAAYVQTLTAGAQPQVNLPPPPTR
jgi:lipid-binding SYLF domain-containing protein